MKLEKINKHFFPDVDPSSLKQYNIFLTSEFTHESITPIMEEISDLNTSKQLKSILTEEQLEGMDEVVIPDVINLFISSPGGDSYAAFSLINIIEGSDIPVRAIGIGQVASAALLTLMGCHQRVVTPYASIMSHQLAADTGGNYSEIETSFKELKSYHEKLIDYFVVKTGMSKTKIQRRFMKHTDTWMSPKEAVENNFADLVSDLK